MRSHQCLGASVGLCVVMAASWAGAGDWPQWRGANRDGISQETGLFKEWPGEGPKLVWQVNDLGRGFSTPAVVGGRVYLMASQGVEDEFVKALDAKNGKPIWSTRVGKVGNPQQKPSFPAARSTPTVDGDALYALGSDGDLVCIELATGKIRWQKSLRGDFGGKPGTWAYAESPLIDGDTLVCAPGGGQATLVALNKKTGEVIWKCALPEADDAAYTSAVVMEAAGVKQYVQVVQKGLVGVEAKTGKFLWRYGKTMSTYGATIPSPVVGDGLVYSAGSGSGGGAVRPVARGGGVEAEQVYFDAKLPTAIGGAVLVGGNLYGCAAQVLVCADFKTGQIKWTDRSAAPGSLCYADGMLYLHGENGEVALVEAKPDGYREHGRFTPANPPKRISGMEKAWAYPVVCDGRLYIRDHEMLWCYEVGK